MWKWLQRSLDLTRLLGWHRRYIEKHSPIKGTQCISSRWIVSMVLLSRAQSLLSSGVSTGKCGNSQRALQPPKYYSSCASGATVICTSFINCWVLQESWSMMPKPRQDQLSFTVLFSILHSPFLQSSSHFSPYQHTMTFFTPQIGFFTRVILPSIILSLSFSANLKSWKMLQCT